MVPLELYRQMARSRAFELVLADLWQQGLVSGEMHLGTGEEAIAAGVVVHLIDGDGMALDHRSTPPLLVRGVDPAAILRELLGKESGLCRGRGGHMHLFSSEHLAASSGIVGASGPLAAGFGIAAAYLRPGSAAVAFFGEGATNQGMLLESWNLAVAWNLPVLFVCKDNRWAITTESARLTGGHLLERARSFGLRSESVDGLDVTAVHEAAGALLDAARGGAGPGFLLAACTRIDGHFLGDPMRRTVEQPLTYGLSTLRRIASQVVRTRGAAPGERIRSVRSMLGDLTGERRSARDPDADPLVRSRSSGMISEAEAESIAAEVRDEMEGAVATALGEEVDS